MRPHLPDAETILLAWERGEGRTPVGRALCLAHLGRPDLDEDTWADMSWGTLRREVLALHRAWFGDRMEALANCLACGEELECVVSAETLRRAGEEPLGGTLPLDVERDGYRVRARPPTARDLLRVEAGADIDEGRRLLLSACVETAVQDDRPTAPGDLPEPVLRDLSAAIAAADPLVECVADVTCPACGHSWQATIDPAEFLWRAVSARARRLVSDVATLARAYGWAERDVLAMSERRRAVYIEAIGT